MRLHVTIGIFLASWNLFCVGCAKDTTKKGALDGPADAVVEEKSVDTLRYEYAGFEEAVNIFNALDYTPEAWHAGIREIPNLQLVKVPERWRNSTSKEIEVKLKKQAFFRVLAPLALSVHKEIQSDRERLKALKKKELSSLSEAEIEQLKQMAVKYRIAKEEPEISQKVLDELWIRVDIVPLSLVLAQSAEESGWGTSRFAAEGNALFGQWAWGENAIKPKEQRSGKGDYGIARFDSPLESMRAYMINLNTHKAYANLRKARAELRDQGKVPDGETLAKTLTRYSERGEAYVGTLLSIMKTNKLAAADEAYLKESPVIMFVPVE